MLTFVISSRQNGTMPPTGLPTFFILPHIKPLSTEECSTVTRRYGRVEKQTYLYVLE
jgi:hypothetical protein